MAKYHKYRKGDRLLGIYKPAVLYKFEILNVHYDGTYLIKCHEGDLWDNKVCKFRWEVVERCTVPDTPLTRAMYE